MEPIPDPETAVRASVVRIYHPVNRLMTSDYRLYVRTLAEAREQTELLTKRIERHELN